MRSVTAVAALFLLIAPAPRAQDDRHAALDKILDTYVRDGYVYYRALKQSRASLDRYVASLAAASVDGWPAADQTAFWINSYNAIVLQTVVNGFPTGGRAPQYPAGSIRQIPGAFERTRHRVAGRDLTLDEIEELLIKQSGDARVVLALGRGAVSSGRLRSEAFSGRRLETQLNEAVRECAARATCVKVDESANTLSVVELIGWRQAAFIATFTPKDERWKNRSPIERAMAAMLTPVVYPGERAWLEANTFRMTYHPFDWRLNDLADR
ncbi:MAG TPA: DUF547 domain-containing protein [Vicinamibacterales bacterium]|nr:DUF547 domain-containing protein [Vicinamibacterales bacterium]